MTSFDDTCCFTFMLERGNATVLVSTNPDGYDNAAVDEFDAETILYFLVPEIRAEDWFDVARIPPASLGPDARIEWTLRELAERVRPHGARVLHLFQPETYLALRQELNAFDELRHELFLQGLGSPPSLL
jgi:hypothetical protein